MLVVRLISECERRREKRIEYFTLEENCSLFGGEWVGGIGDLTPKPATGCVVKAAIHKQGGPPPAQGRQAGIGCVGCQSQRWLKYNIITRVHMEDLLSSMMS